MNPLVRVPRRDVFTHGSVAAVSAHDHDPMAGIGPTDRCACVDEVLLQSFGADDRTIGWTHGIE